MQNFSKLYVFDLFSSLQVMFNEEKVGDVKIYNVQQDCCYDQLEGATVSVFNEDFDEVC